MSEKVIKDLSHYTEQMRKSLEEKTFFIDKIKADSFLDYGCADGTLLKYLQHIYPNYRYMGYDICKEMLRLANKDSHDIVFTDNLNLFDILRTENSAVILSSIIHEIYSYANPFAFWEEIFETIKPKYIVIRDMMISSKQEVASNQEIVENVRSHADLKQLEDFESKWGTIDTNKNLLHYLLKYRYIENWERESVENYLPVTLERMISKIPSNYKITYLEHYTQPYLKEVVKKDFNIDLEQNTHIKIIIERID